MYIAGAQIIDLMMLVVDITKGVQTQTAECLVIGEITCDKMIVVLNKVDLIPGDKRAATIDRVCRFYHITNIVYKSDLKLHKRKYSAEHIFILGLLCVTKTSSRFGYPDPA